MLDRWLKKDSQLEHADSDVRLQALHALSAEQALEAQDLILNIVYKDPDKQLRRRALAHVIDPDLLVRLLEDAEIAADAAKHIATRIKQGHTTRCHDHSLVLKARIAQAGAEDIEALWPLLATPEHCAELALHYRDELRERLLSHPLLCDENGLGVLQRVSRGKDKGCHRHAREGLDAIKTARTLCSKNQARLSELDISIEKALRTPPKDTAGQLAYRQKLAKLQSMRDEVVASVHTALNDLIVAGGATRQLNIPADPLADFDLTPPDPGDNPFVSLVEGWTELADAMRAGAAIESIASQHDELTQAWLSHAGHLSPDAKQHQQFEAVSRQFQAYKAAWLRLGKVTAAGANKPETLPQTLLLNAELQRLLSRRQKWCARWQQPMRDLEWPPQHVLPQPAHEIQHWLDRANAEIDQIKSVLASAEKDMSIAVGSATEALEAGQLESAKGHLRSARLMQKAGIRKFDRKLAALSAQVAEFRDWQQFATDPKRQELITVLQALCDAPNDPAIQADHLKILREQWLQLGRPASPQERDLQRQFDALADTAFAPCRSYFAEQSEIRAANLSVREALCDQMAQYLAATDWNSADMGAAETILRSAREEWHKSHPCERKALKPVQARFEKLQNDLHGKIKTWWDANVRSKRLIVEQAKALLLEQEVAVQIEGAKTLQRNWRDVGSTPRGVDQRLWREFREVCDQIFAQRDAHNKNAQAQLKKRHQALEDAVAALEAATSDAQPTRKTLDTLDAAIDAAAVDTSLNPALRKRIQHAQSAYRRAFQGETRKQAEQELQQWQEWDEQISSAEQHGDPIDAPHAVFSNRTNGTAVPANWLNLTLEAEIAAELPSPAENQSARMALQIEFMNAGKRNLAVEDYRELRQRWCEAGPKDTAADALRSRFFNALQQRL